MELPDSSFNVDILLWSLPDGMVIWRMVEATARMATRRDAASATLVEWSYSIQWSAPYVTQSWEAIRLALRRPPETEVPKSTPMDDKSLLGAFLPRPSRDYTDADGASPRGAAHASGGVVPVRTCSVEGSERQISRRHIAPFLRCPRHYRWNKEY